MARRGGYLTVVEGTLTYKAFVEMGRGNMDTARSLLDNVLASAKQGGRLGNAAEAQFFQGWLRSWNGEPEAAAEQAEALRLAEQAGDVWLAAAAAAFLGRTLILAGDFDQGIRLLERSRSDFQAVGDPVFQVIIAIAEAIGEIRTSRFAEAQATLTIGLDLAELAGSPANAAEMMIWVADWLEHLGRHAEAARLCGALHSILTSIGYRLQQAEQEAVSHVEAACPKVLGSTGSRWSTARVKISTFTEPWPSPGKLSPTSLLAPERSGESAFAWHGQPPGRSLRLIARLVFEVVPFRQLQRGRSWACPAEEPRASGSHKSTGLTASRSPADRVADTGIGGVRKSKGGPGGVVPIIPSGVYRGRETGTDPAVNGPA